MTTIPAPLHICNMFAVTSENLRVRGLVVRVVEHVHVTPIIPNRYELPIRGARYAVDVGVVDVTTEDTLNWPSEWG